VLQQRWEDARRLREQDLPTVPSHLHEELDSNPFLRTRVSQVVDSASRHAERHLSSEVEVFAQLREWKNNF